MELKAPVLNRTTIAGITAAVALIAGGWIAYAKSGVGATKPTAKQQAAALFDYPSASADMPKAITIEYTVAKDRSIMTLELDGLAVRAPSGFQTTAASLAVRSEFSGRARDPRKGELSVRMILSVHSNPAGALAPSSPIAEFETDGHKSQARGPSDHSSGYHAAKGNAPESLEFRVSTKDLLAIAHANTARLKAGAVVITLSSHELSLLREFVARMNPRLGSDQK